LPGPAVVWMILMNAIYLLLAIDIINYVNILQSPVVVNQIYLKFNCTLKTLLRLGISRPDLCGADSLSVACRLHNL
jgi:hypothetical protein